MKKIVILLISTLFILSLKLVSAEETTDELDDYEIVTVDEKKGSSIYTRKINFINNTTDEITNSIDVVEDNPYHDLNYKKYDNPDFTGFSKYQSIPIDQMFPDTSMLNQELISEYEGFIPYAYTTFAINLDNPNYIAILYFLVSLGFEEQIGSKVTVQVYDKKGKLLYSLNDLVDGIDNACISVDGNYLIYSYARSNYNYGHPVYNFKPGIKLYNINEDTMELRREVKENYELMGVRNKEDKFQVSMKNYEHDIYRFEIFDIEERIIFSKEFTRNERKFLQEITEKGFLFGKNSKDDIKTYLKEYHKDFSMENF